MKEYLLESYHEHRYQYDTILKIQDEGDWYVEYITYAITPPSDDMCSYDLVELSSDIEDSGDEFELADLDRLLKLFDNPENELKQLDCICKLFNTFCEKCNPSAYERELRGDM